MDVLILGELSDHIKIVEQTVIQSEQCILELVSAICSCFSQGNKLLLIGNGGSAADAQHMAAEFVNRFRFDRSGLPAIALTTDTSILTCIGNDLDFENIFSRQVEVLAVKGDILIGISTSGGSVNILKALDTARIKGVITVGFTGEKGQENMAAKCDRYIVVPSSDTARIQECHEFILHVICGMVENALFKVQTKRGIYQSMKQLSLEKQLDNLLSEDVDFVKRREYSIFDKLTSPLSDSLILFGSGNLGRKTLAGLRKIGIEPKAFSDNNSALWNTLIDDLIVLSPNEAAQKYRDKATFVITIWRALGGDEQANRREQLLKLNCQKVISFGYLYWKYPDIFLPHYALDEPYKLLENSDDIRKVFYLWDDDSSKNEYLAQLRFRLLLDFDGLPSPVAHKQYFADDLFSIKNNEVFVDVGAFDGDTVKEFLQLQDSNFHRVVALEPDLINYKKLVSYFSSLPLPIRDKVKALRIAAGARREKVRFEAKGTVQSSISNIGTIEIDCAPLDEILKGLSPTFFKMDIEGYEIDALLGGSKMINKSVPILAICVYHRPDHIYRIPLLIHSWSDQYRFYLRPHDEECWDTVCYAIPTDRLTNLSAGRA